MVVLELKEDEAQELLRLLEEHRYFGWIGLRDELEAEASWITSPQLVALYTRLKRLLAERKEAVA